MELADLPSRVIVVDSLQLKIVTWVFFVHFLVVFEINTSTVDWIAMSA